MGALGLVQPLQRAAHLLVPGAVLPRELLVLLFGRRLAQVSSLLAKRWEIPLWRSCSPMLFAPQIPMQCIELYRDVKPFRRPSAISHILHRNHDDLVKISPSKRVILSSCERKRLLTSSI